MNKFSIGEICDFVKGDFTLGNSNFCFDNIVIDSRDANLNTLFIPIIGEKYDGHDFMDDAYNNGCRCFLCDQNHSFYKKDINLVAVDNTTRAYGIISSCYKEKMDIITIGITGSVGKTSTKDIISSVVDKKYKTLRTIGNLNNEIGVPKTLLNLDTTYELAVIEMGMNKKGEIDYLTRLVKPNIAVVTNIGMSHIMNFPDGQEGIFESKMEIVNGLTNDGILIVNGDDKYLKKLINIKHNYKLLTYGFEDYNDIVCEKYKMDGKVISFDCIYNKKSYSFSVPSVAKHNIGNSMAAILIGFELGLDYEMIKQGLIDVNFTNNRLDEIKTTDYIIIDDTYNSSYDSVISALEVLNSYKGRKVAVLGDILELGDYSQDIHRKIGQNIDCDVLITIGKNAKFIYEEVLSKNIESYYFEKKEDFMKIFDSILMKDDVVLLKASNGMMFKDIVSFLKGV